VSAETTRYLDLLERRLALLGALADALTAARTDVVALDIDGLHARIGDQERLCAEIRALDAQLNRVQKQCATRAGSINSASSDADAVRCREIVSRLKDAQASVKRLNDEHRMLLRRSRRTVNALLNSYHSFALTYANPSDPRSARSAGVPAGGFACVGEGL
jgi:Mg2+ and Co2+ transporter CorA